MTSLLPQRRILVVDDNAATLKLLRGALEGRGFEVVTADRGSAAIASFWARRPDLVLQGLKLRDIGGFELLTRFRNIPGGGDVPIVALTGLLSAAEEARLAGARFDAVLVKPIDPALALETVRRFLPSGVRQSDRGERKLVLVVDDGAVQREHACLLLASRGFEVRAASTGEEALEVARRERPDAILSDLLMPGMDGFALCRRVRQDPALQRIPVVLLSARFIDEEDRRTAREVGADALMSRTASLEESIAVLVDGLSHVGTPTPLAKQVEVNAGLVQRCAVLGAALEVLNSLSHVIGARGDFAAALEDALRTAMDVSGATSAALYCWDDGAPPRLAAQAGEITPEQIFDPEEVRARLDGDTSLAEGDGLSCGIFAGLDAANTRRGALYLGFAGRRSVGEDRLALAKAVAVQIGHGLALEHAISSSAKAEQRYRGLVENASDGIFILSPEGTVREANAGAEQIHGRKRGAMAGARFADQFPEQAGLRRWLEDGGRETFRADGVPVAGVPGKNVLVELTARRVDLGGASEIIAIERDATERVVLGEQLRQAQKMEAIGRLTGGIAHDFNNVLAAILSSAELLLADGHQSGEDRELVYEIKRAGERAAKLTHQLLAFSRRQVLSTRAIDLNDVVGGLEKMVRTLLGADIALSIERGAIGAVRADPAQLEQVVLNMVVNARDAMRPGGSLTVRTSAEHLAKPIVRDTCALPAGSFTVMTIADTGCGMDDATLKKIFEPFFTTKEAGRGTGLGLSTCYGIVTQLGGFIDVTSEPGRGTSFRVYLPELDVRAEPVAPPRPSLVPRGSETVLVIEDDPHVGPMVMRLLTRSGYRPLIATDGVGAMKIASSHSGPIHLILSDMVFPGGRGTDLVVQLRELQPFAKVVFMSGYIDPEVVAGAEDMPGTSFIQKPFTPEQLATKLRSVLDT